MNKAQASIEFLSTYAWAISIVVVLVGVVAYFGVFDTNAFVKPYCTLTKELVCDDYAVFRNAVNISLRNNFEKDITIYDFIIRTDTTPPVICSQGEKNISIGSTEILGCNFNSNVISKGDKKKIIISVVYSRKGGINKYNATGSVLAPAGDPI